MMFPVARLVAAEHSDMSSPTRLLAELAELKAELKEKDEELC